MFIYAATALLYQLYIYYKLLLTNYHIKPHETYYTFANRTLHTTRHTAHKNALQISFPHLHDKITYKLTPSD